MAEITSVSNPRVKYVRSLDRRRTRYRESAFVVEGKRLVMDALQAGAHPRMAFYTEPFEASPDGGDILERVRQSSDEAFSVSSAVMDALADTVTPQGLLVVVSMPQWPPPAAPARLALILDRWRDPGNLGTVLRTAEAAGVDWVGLTHGSVDPFSPKVVRAGMGAHFRLPVHANLAWSFASGLAPVPVYLADAGASPRYDAVDWTTPSILVVGGEAHGLGEDAEQVHATRIAIPMQGSAESLNAAVAASVIMMEAARQRRQRGT